MGSLFSSSLLGEGIPGPNPRGVTATRRVPIQGRSNKLATPRSPGLFATMAKRRAFQGWKDVAATARLCGARVAALLQKEPGTFCGSSAFHPRSPRRRASRKGAGHPAADAGGVCSTDSCRLILRRRLPIRFVTTLLITRKGGPRFALLYCVRFVNRCPPAVGGCWWRKPEGCHRWRLGDCRTICAGLPVAGGLRQRT